MKVVLSGLVGSQLALYAAVERFRHWRDVAVGHSAGGACRLTAGHAHVLWSVAIY